MSIDKKKRMIGEYDPPMPERIKNPTKADFERLAELEEKYKRMKENRTKA